jgi:DNA-directed RNA polymerase specialized sigma24 family protein
MSRGALTEDERLEHEADVLLRELHAANNHQFPAFTERQLARREVRRIVARKNFINLIRLEWDLQGLCRREIALALSWAGVPAERYEVLRLRLLDRSYAEIAAGCSVSKTTVCRWCARHLPRVRQYPGLGIITILRETFPSLQSSLARLIIDRERLVD